MLELLNNIAFYKFNDSSIGLYTYALRFLGKGALISNSSYNVFTVFGIDFGTNFILNSLSYFFPPLVLNNGLALIALLLNLIFFYKLFWTINPNRIPALIFALTASISNYFLFRIMSGTPALYLTFFIPILLTALIRKKHPIVIGLIVLGTFTFSNYYGYFTFVTSLLWYFIELIQKEMTIRNWLLSSVTVAGFILLGLFVSFPKLFISNLPITEAAESKTNTLKVNRPMEDWYSLSIRPWYFVIPPNRSLIFGEISKEAYKRIESTGYYLNDDYVDDEMGGLYIGWHILIMSITAGYYTFIKNKHDTPDKLVQRSLLVVFGLLLISGPPIFTLAGISIYTPSYLLYFIVPFFRSLVRWGVVIYPLVLVSIYPLYVNCLKTLQIKASRITIHGLFLLTTFVLTGIRIPIIHSSDIPEHFSWIKSQNISTQIAIFPTANYDSIFWATQSGVVLANPRDYENYVTGVSDKSVFEALLKCDQGNMNAEYVIVDYSDISRSTISRVVKINPLLDTPEAIKHHFDNCFERIVNFSDDITIYKTETYE